MSLEKINPAFSVVNLRPKGGKSNYLTIGADNDFGALITDSPGGFVFRKGGDYGLNDNEINLNQGDDLVTIRPDGKVGIGISPKQYELDIFGNARLFTLYLDTDLKKVQDPKPLDDVLNQVMKLNPIRFRWNGKRTSCPDTEEQLGFLPHEVEEFFPEVVKTHEDNSKALAYPNLVAVLTKAIQQQQEQIAALEKRLARLESGNQCNTHPMEDIKIITTEKNSGFPEYIDFATLRSEGIDHIAAFSGKVWTDHNLHDPGITTLEALCYVLTDLDYRSKLDFKDLVARQDTTPENNFLTSAQIPGQ